MRKIIIAVLCALALGACSVTRIDVHSYAGVKVKDTTAINLDCRGCAGVVVSFWQ